MHGAMSSKIINESYGSVTANVTKSNSEQVRRRKNPTGVFKLLGAILCIAIVIGTWVAMAEFLQDMQKHYHKPFFTQYLVHSSYSIVYIIWKLWIVFPGWFACNRVGEGALTNFKNLAISSCVLMTMATGSGYLWYLSLPRTNIPANTSAFQSASAFVFIISVPLLKERVTLLKVMSVLVSISGVTMVSFYSNTQCNHHSNNTTGNLTNEYDYIGGVATTEPDSCNERSTPLGYVFLVLSVIVYAMYETFYKKFGTVKDDPAAVLNGARYIGYIGVHTLIWTWPVVIVLHYTKVEVFEWPSMTVFYDILLNSVLDIALNVALLVAISLSSPLFTSVGTILTVPTSVIVDWARQHFLLPWQAFVGIAIIIVGFTGFTISEFVELRRHTAVSKSKIKHEASRLSYAGVITENSIASSDSVPLLPEENTRPHKKWTKILQYLV